MLETDDELEWWHLAVCKGMDTNYFYDGYESDPVFASVMDSVCLSCPVRAMCLREGIENQEDGLWGGVFLNKGKTDQSRNAHKTDEVWDEIRDSLVG